MHEFGLLKSIMHKLNEIAQQENVIAFSHIKIKIGALAHISAEHFKEHFDHAAAGTPAEHANLELIMLEDTEHPQAQEIILDSVQVVQQDEAIENTTSS